MHVCTDVVQAANLEWGLKKSGVHLGGKQDKTGEDLPLTKLSIDHTTSVSTTTTSLSAIVHVCDQKQPWEET
jgi:hypothetical protein